MGTPTNDDAWDEAKAAVAPWIRKSTETELDQSGVVVHTDGYNYALDLHQFPPGYRNT
jgi:hypothetical protein